MCISFVFFIAIHTTGPDDVFDFVWAPDILYGPKQCI